jgi:hypothetical protein
MPFSGGTLAVVSAGDRGRAGPMRVAKRIPVTDRRIEPRQWLLTEYVGEDASLPVLGLDVPLREFYANLDLLEEGVPESGAAE